VANDPGVLANGYIASAPTSDGLTAAVVTTPVRFSNFASSPVADVPELGQHTEEVLLEVGYSWDDIAALSAAGAI